MSTMDLRRQSEAMVARGQVREAGELIRDALELQPFDTHLTIAKANIMLAGRQFRQAIEALQPLTQRRPEEPDPLFLLGNAYRATRLFAEARSAYQRVANIRADYPGVQHYLGICCQNLGDLDAATNAFELAVQARPEMAVLHHRLGSVHHMAGRLGEAIACYQQALRREPGFLQSRTNLTLALIAAERYPEANVAAREHLGVAPRQTLALASQAYAALADHDLETANRLLDFGQLLHTHKLGLDAEQRIALRRYIAEQAPAAPSDMRGSRLTAQLDNTHSALAPLVAELAGPIQTLTEALTASGIEIHPPANGWVVRAWGEIRHANGLDSRCHPAATMGGIYYVDCEDWDIAGGGEEFGRGDDVYRQLAPAQMPVESFEPGKLLLFPAWFYHRAMPNQDAATGYSLIIDVAEQ